MKKKINYLTDAAMIVAFMAVLLLISNLTAGAIVSTFTFLLPIPVTIYGLKYNWKLSIIPAISSIIVGLIINWLVGLLYVLPSCLLAILYSLMLKTNKKIQVKIFVMISGAIIINILTTVLFSKVLFGYTIVEDTLAIVDTLLKSLKLIMTIPEWLEKTTRALLVSIIPATIVIMSYMEAVITYFVISLISKIILKTNMDGLSLVFSITVPRLVTYILLPISLVSLGFIDKIVNYESFGVVQVFVSIGINILVILILLYILEAIVLLSMFFTKIRKPYLNFVTFLLLIFVPFVLAICGLIDSLFDLKYKIITK